MTAVVLREYMQYCNLFLVTVGGSKYSESGAGLDSLARKPFQAAGRPSNVSNSFLSSLQYLIANNHALIKAGFKDEVKRAYNMLADVTTKLREATFAAENQLNALCAPLRPFVDALAAYVVKPEGDSETEAEEDAITALVRTVFKAGQDLDWAEIARVSDDAGWLRKIADSIYDDADTLDRFDKIKMEFIGPTGIDILRPEVLAAIHVQTLRRTAQVEVAVRVVGIANPGSQNDGITAEVSIVDAALLCPLTPECFHTLVSPTPLVAFRMDETTIIRMHGAAHLLKILMEGKASRGAMFVDMLGHKIARSHRAMANLKRVWRELRDALLVTYPSGIVAKRGWSILEQWREDLLNGSSSLITEAFHENSLVKCVRSERFIGLWTYLSEIFLEHDSNAYQKLHFRQRGRLDRELTPLIDSFGACGMSCWTAYFYYLADPLTQGFVTTKMLNLTLHTVVTDDVLESGAFLLDPLPNSNEDGADTFLPSVPKRPRL